MTRKDYYARFTARERHMMRKRRRRSDARDARHTSCMACAAMCRRDARDAARDGSVFALEARRDAMAEARVWLAAAASIRLGRV